MRTSDEIYHEVRRLILAEMLATADSNEVVSIEAIEQARQVRFDLLPLMQEAAELRIIVLLLDIERAFLSLELEYIAHDSDNIKSLLLGIWQLDAATAMLDYVRDSDEYLRAGIFYTYSQNLVTRWHLPKDGAHRFFGSHKTRLNNMKNGPMHVSQAALFDARIDNIKLARDIYIELQRQALTVPGTREQLPEPAPSEVREPTKTYRVEGKAKLAA